jgi:DNA-binding NarL/FixJ family response regulator
MSLTRIVVADDHAVVRAGIRSILQQSLDIEMVGEAGNGMEALRLVEELSPDVLVLDMEMPGMGGVDVARRLKAARSPVRILALSAYDDEQYVYGLLTSGAAGYLLKEEAPTTLIDAVRGISSGARGWISTRVAARMAAHASQLGWPAGNEDKPVAGSG